MNQGSENGRMDMLVSETVTSKFQNILFLQVNITEDCGMVAIELQTYDVSNPVLLIDKLPETGSLYSSNSSL